MFRTHVVPLFLLVSSLALTPHCAAQAARFPQAVAVGSSAPPLTVTLALPQGGAVAAIKLTTQGSEGFDFADATGGSCSVGTTYLPGQQCSVVVAFRPTSPGQRLGAIVLLDQAGATLAMQFLTGSATGPVATFIPGAINAVAGDSAWIYSGDGGPATQAALFLPFGLAVNARGDLFIADSSNNRIRKVDGVTGLISTVAGSGLIGASGDGGAATLATLSNPSSIALDPAGNLYFADSGNNAIRRIDAFTGLIRTVAGTLGPHGNTGDNGPATRATLNTPNGIALDAAGNLYIADTGNHVIRMVNAATGLILRVAGIGVANFGGDGGPALGAALNAPWGVTLAVTGELYIADQNNHRIRQVDKAGFITTVFGNGTAGFAGDNGPASAAKLNVPAAVAIDVAGNVYIADSGNNRVRKVNAKTGAITTIAGGDSQSFSGDSGPADQAGLYGPYALALDGQGSLFIADVFHNRIRKVSSNAATLDFPPMRAGRVSAAMGQALENDGNAPLNLQNILAVTNSQLDASATTCAAGLALDPLDQCNLAISFAPTSTGLFVIGSLDVLSDASNSQGVVTLVGQVLDTDPVKFTVTSSSNPSMTGALVTFTVTAESAGTTPTGAVTLFDGSAVLGVAALQKGVAQFPVTSLAAGLHSMTAAYPGDGNNAAGVSGPLLQVVTDPQAPTVTTLAANVNPLDAGAPLLLSAAVSVATQGAGSGAISGRVSFREGANLLGVATIASGTATLSIGTLTVGSHAITATYSGNAAYAASSSAVMVERVELATTRIALSSSANPSKAGAPLSLSAVLLGTGGIPAGTVAFYDGANSLGSATLNAQGVATLATPGTLWTVGTHSLAARYAGDASNGSSVSQLMAQTVNLAATTIVLGSSLNPAGLGGQVIFAVSVSGDGGIPSGSVQVFDGASPLGTVTLNASGNATLATAALPLGLHPITAAYSGDAMDGSATSAPLTQVVQQATVAVALSSSGNPANVAAPLTFTATVAGTGSIPTGTVTFQDGPNALATVALGAGGLASFTSSTLALGTHNMVAQYSGDANHAAFASNLLAQRVVQATSTVLVLSLNRSIAGTPVNFTATVRGTNGIAVTGLVTFTDGASTLATVATDPNGLAVFSPSGMVVGTHTIVATYLGDALDATSESLASALFVTIATSSIALASSVNPSIAGAALVLTSSVTGNGGIPAGSVTFHDGAVTLSTVPLNAVGVASLTISTLAPGIHLLSASYSGDANDQPALSSTLSQQVAEQTSMTIVSSANPSLLTDAVTITVTVLNGVPGAPPTGSVTLSDGGATVGSALVDATGAASFSLVSPTVGTHSLVARYAGDANDTPATSQPLLQTVVLRPAATSLTSSATALAAGQQLILIAIVQPSSGTANRAPGGQVSFQSGANTLGTASLNAAGVATLTLNAAAGIYNAVALYSGDALYAASTSTPTLITVGPPVEFTLSTQSSLTLQSGQHATLTIGITTAPTFNDTLAIGCAGLPASATCTFSESQFAVGGGLPRSLTVLVDTGSPLGAGASAQLSPNQWAPTGNSGILACLLPAGALLALLLRGPRRRIRSLGLLTALLALAATSALSGCGTSFTLNATPPGSYVFQIVATGIHTHATQTASVQLSVTK